MTSFVGGKTMMTNDNEHRAIALLREYDALKRQLWQMEQELNRECATYGKEKLGLLGFAPNHLRQRLAAIETVNMKKEQAK